MIGEHAAAPLRIGLDGFNLAMPRGTGVATYGRVLSQALDALGHTVDVLYGLPISAGTSAFLREVLFFEALDNEKRSKGPAILGPRWVRDVARGTRGVSASVVPVTGSVIHLDQAGRLPHFDRLLNVFELFEVAMRYFRLTGRFFRVRVPDPPAIMHWTYPVPIRLEGARNIYTMHDLVPLRLPYTTLDNKRTYLRLLSGCLRAGDHICTVSEASRRDIVTLLGVAPDRVTNTYQSASMQSPPVPESELHAWLSGLFGLARDGYFLFFGALEPKKNIGRMIEAYLSSDVATPLVIIGGRAWKAENELRLVGARSSTRASSRVHQMDYVPETWLSGLISGARGVLFASLYEGFGLPVLEAMQRGTPVIGSNTSSLPEVAGEAALLVDPYDVGAITSAIRRLDADATLRARLAQMGLVQARIFAPDRYRERLAKLYGAVMAGPAAPGLLPRADGA